MLDLTPSQPADKEEREALQWLVARMERARKVGLFTEAGTLTPPMARVILARFNHGNRRVRARNVQNLAAEAKAGRWLLKGAGLSFALDGQLNNGQHRCHACALSGVALPMNFAFGESRDVFRVEDAGMAVRGGQDVLFIQGEAQSSILAAALRALHVIGRGGRSNTQVSNQGIAELLEAHPLMRASAAPGHRLNANLRGISAAGGAAAHYLIATRSAFAARLPDFWGGFARAWTSKASATRSTCCGAPSRSARRCFARTRPPTSRRRSSSPGTSTFAASRRRPCAGLRASPSRRWCDARRTRRRDGGRCRHPRPGEDARAAAGGGRAARGQHGGHRPSHAARGALRGGGDLPGVGEVHGVPVLVAGRHRLEAARQLGWEQVSCVAIADERDARLWEIAENLHRAELTVQERADHIAEWVRLVSAKLAETPKPKAGRPGAIDAARRELGISEGDARRAVKIAAIAPEARAVADAAGLTTQKARLEIAAAPTPAEQVRRAEAIAARPKPVPLPKNEIETEQDWRNAMMRLWNRAPDEWRERFIEYVQDVPVMDGRWS